MSLRGVRRIVSNHLAGDVRGNFRFATCVAQAAAIVIAEMFSTLALLRRGLSGNSPSLGSRPCGVYLSIALVARAKVERAAPGVIVLFASTACPIRRIRSPAGFGPG